VLLATAAVVSVALPVASADAKGSVSQHVKRSDAQIAKVIKEAKKGHQRSALKALKAARHEAAVAGRLAGKRAEGAKTGSAQKDAAAPVGLAAGQYDDMIAQFSALIDQVKGQIQKALADALAPALAGRQELINLLTQLVDKLPPPMKQPAQQILADAASQTANDPAQIADPIPDLPKLIAGIVTQAFAAATGIVETVLGMIGPMAGNYPGQDPLDGSVTDLTGVVGGFPSLIGGILPTITGLGSSICKMVMGPLSQVMGLVDDLLGSFLGGGHSTPATGTGQQGGGFLSGLFGNGGLIGSLFGKNGLLGGLFGGLLGGTA
jgi:hypothetical protein